MKEIVLDDSKYKIRYFPVLSQLNYRLTTNNTTIRITDFYKRILVNSFYMKGSNSFHLDFLKKNGIEVMADSGGWQFQIGRLKESDLTGIFDFQSHFGDWIFQLDLPDYINNSIDAWKKSIKRTKSYSEYFLNTFGKKDKYIPVLHGNTYEKLTLWHDMLRDLDYENIAISTKVDNTVSNAFGYILALLWWLKNSDVKVNMLHLLGFTKTPYLPLFIYLHKKYEDRFKYLSFDSITPNFLGINMKYQYGNNGEYQGDINLRKNIEFQKRPFPCNCEFCQFANKTYGTVGNFISSSPQDVYTLLYLHHLQHYIERIIDAYNEAMKIDEIGLRKYLLEKYLSKSKKSLWNRNNLLVLQKGIEDLDYVNSSQFKNAFESIAKKSGMVKTQIKRLVI